MIIIETGIWGETCSSYADVRKFCVLPRKCGYDGISDRTWKIVG